jgi:hypothetical protein
MSAEDLFVSNYYVEAERNKIQTFNKEKDVGDQNTRCQQILVNNSKKILVTRERSQRFLYFKNSPRAARYLYELHRLTSSTGRE